ncbi:MAG TPA: phage tail protein [Allosphingosinicella sp.]|jgi:phage tail-like protein
MADDGSAQNAIWPLPKFYFSIDLGDGKKLGFSEISGLESDIKPIEYRHGDSKVFSTLKMPGLRSVGNVTLKKGVFTQDSIFWKWFDESKLNIIKRRTVVISLLDEQSAPKMTWTLTNAWPTKMTGTDLKSDSNEVAIESLELAYETLSVTAA